MTEFLLGLFLIVQANSLLPVAAGTVTGIVRTPDGKPAKGVRVVAVSPLESPASAGVTTLVSLTESDEQGRYRLENVPAGRHYIAAGRLEFMTYYPGEATIATATPVQISAETTLAGIDFVCLDESILLLKAGRSRISEVTIPVRVIPEQGTKIPVNVYGKDVEIHFIQSSTGARTVLPLMTAALTLPVDSGEVTKYQVRVENLPDGYTVKSMSYDSVDLTDGMLLISRSKFFIPRPNAIVSGLGSSTLTLPVRAASMEALTINLTRMDTFQRVLPGVRVAGRDKYPGYRTVYISGRPGIFYSDGTFEFQGVTPGRHAIVAVDGFATSPTLGASVVIGSDEVEGVELDVISAVPFAAGVPMEPGPAANHPPGAQIALATLDVGIVGAVSREWIPGGTLIISGHTRVGYSFRGPDGRFEVYGLFPGKYEIEFQNYGYVTIRQSLVVGEEDIHLEFALQPDTR